MSDLVAMARAVQADPRDALALAALADAAEEAGADVGCLRTLSAVGADAPTLLIIGMPEGSSQEAWENTRGACDEAARWLSRASGHEVGVLVVHAGTTVRQVRAALK